LRNLGEDLIDNDHVDLAGPHIVQESLQGWPVGVAAREAQIAVRGCRAFDRARS
jgi:hypothetical protein